jgi:hypothetical protein
MRETPKAFRYSLGFPLPDPRRRTYAARGKWFTRQKINLNSKKPKDTTMDNSQKTTDLIT